MVRGRQWSTQMFMQRTDEKRRALFSRNGEVSASSLVLFSEVGLPQWVGYRISLCAFVCVCVTIDQKFRDLHKSSQTGTH